MSKSKLTEEQIKTIAYSELSLNKLAELYFTSRHTIIVIKTEHNTCRGRGRGTRATGFKVSDEQKYEIVKSELSYAELAIKFDVHESTIGKIKRKAGIRVARRNHNRSKLVLTDAMIERIKDLTISARSLSDEIGISAESISRQRKKLGLSFREFQKNKPKAKRIQKPRAYKPRPKKDKPVKEAKVIEPKVIIQKLKSEVKRAAMVKNKFEEYNAEMRKAERAKAKYHETETRQKAEGFRFVTRMGKHGIKETVWTKQ